MTPAQKQQIQTLLSLPPQHRAAELERIAFEADVCPHEARKAELRELLLAVSRAEMMPAQPQKQDMPDPPTWAETAAVLKWGITLVAPFAVGFGVLFLTGAAVVGIGDALRATLYENRAIVGFVLCGLLFIALASALFSNREKEPEAAEPETRQSQTVIVNVFTSQNGDVSVKSGK